MGETFNFPPSSFCPVAAQPPKQMGTLSFFSQVKSPLAWSDSLFSCFLSFVGGRGLGGESCVSLVEELSVVLFEVSGSLVGGRGMGA